MLDYAQLEVGKLRLTYSVFDINSTLKNLVSLLNFKASLKNIQLNVDIDKELTTIRSDENRFK